MSLYRLSELCEVCVTDVTPSRSFSGPGEFDVVGNGKRPRGRHDIANIPANTIIISRKGSYGHVSKYSSPVYLTNEAYYLSHISPIVDRDYLYFYLKYINPESIRRVNYRNWKGLSSSKLLNLTVYLPRHEEQTRIVEDYSDFEAHGSSDELWLSETTLKTVEHIQRSVAQHRTNFVTEPPRKKTIWRYLMLFIFVTIIMLSFDSFIELPAIAQHIHKLLADWAAVVEISLKENWKKIKINENAGDVCEPIKTVF